MLGRIMTGVQFFEAQIDDQVLSVDDYVTLLGKHGFGDVDWFEITPVHAVIHGRKWRASMPVAVFGLAHHAGAGSGG